jgi:23S rRNA (uracil1939-C5)-methyltransferase
LIGSAYGEQLAHKGRRVEAAMSRYRALRSTPIDPVIGADAMVGYRTRAKLMVDADGSVGLFDGHGGHRVVDIVDCLVLTPALAAVASWVRGRIAESNGAEGLSPFDPSGAGWLRAIDLREVRERDRVRVLVTLVGDRTRMGAFETVETIAAELMTARPEVAGVALNLHDGKNPQVLGPETRLLCGVASAPDQIGASVHLATFGSFVQVHREQAARMHELVLASLDARRLHSRRPRVLDLYGGSGAIALSLASAGAEVHLVESFAPAAAQARAAVVDAHLDVTVSCNDAGAAVRALREEGAHFDAAVVNPPRRGASPDTREGLARLGPDVIVYVSCEPDTLARDLNHFAALGYAADILCPLDMIPLTDEVETLAVLRLGPLPDPQILYEDEEVLILQKEPHEPTEAPEGPSLLARARRLPNAASCIPVTRLDRGVSGGVVFVRDAAFIAKWEKVLAQSSTRTAYLAAVQGVTPSKGTIARALHEKGALLPATTRYRRLGIAGGHSLLQVVPDTGSAYRARRHLAAIGHPVIGDDRHGHAPTNRYFAEKHALDRPFVHWARLQFDDPEGRGRRTVDSPLPGDLRAVLLRMGMPARLQGSIDSGAARAGHRKTERDA